MCRYYKLNYFTHWLNDVIRVDDDREMAKDENTITSGTNDVPCSSILLEIFARE